MSTLSPAELREQLAAGAANAEPQSLRRELGLNADADDAALAVALVQAVTGSAVPTLAEPGPVAERGSPDPSRILRGRTSYLMRLGAETKAPGLNLQQLRDARTLLAVARAGTLFERRAAILRIGELIDDPKALAADQMAHVVRVLPQLRRFDVAYELSAVCAKLPGSPGRHARTQRREWDALVQRLLPALMAHWDSEQMGEPLMALPGEERVPLLARCRDLPDEVVAHLAAILESAEPGTGPNERIALLTAVQNAGDKRLLPSLCGLLNGPGTDLLASAARALCRIEDARAHPALRAIYERSMIAEQRLVLAGALGVAGDARGLPYVRSMLENNTDVLRPLAFEALAELGTGDDAQALPLDSLSGASLKRGIRALEQIGDGRALEGLGRLATSGANSALRGDIEDASAAIRARLELLGEEAPPSHVAAQSFDTAKMAVMRRQQDPTNVRLRARWSLWLAHTWLFLGSRARAASRFETAASLRPEWATPVLALALLHARADDHTLALASFRRAIDIDRAALERHTPAVCALAQAFLRRSEAVERDGRHDIALGLIEEALSLDLRRAPSGLRFALNQRHEALRSRST